MKHVLFLLFIGVIVVSCKKEQKLEAEIAAIDSQVNVERFDALFAKVTPETLPDLKNAYPFMFSEKFPDSFWIAKTTDTLETQIFKEVNKTFNDFSKTSTEIASLFNHLKYYFPSFKQPRVITTTSDVDYRNKVIVTDTIALIALDNYLGSDHEFYQSIPVYIRNNMNKDQIVVDMASEYATKFIYERTQNTFLDKIIYYGKQLYFKDVVLPFKTEAARISYSQEQLDWAKANESYIWRYFVERELLYSTDSKLDGRFITPAPFSKFYLEGIDSESPGRLGPYIGWQIVKAYMEHNTITINEMLDKSAEEIFNNSKFKPRK
ncbi:gliding motility lipoprotein GldB [Siansivirga zeaxanthinifaciens]|uniref:Gliding motility protein GldB n=1 Tax=Siansivirga zeaxanthinifaciens CC-SAMT-1 TaxID=1454006 RepID=A0A0C5WKL8_9FLAO|nr:gliding motility lipoprotein GldB [Siansivirga zeaxanthinifaciens]AJR03325.1 gliding motility protein GldB [Siansivirga zeaxanthinifaciens CC-SAMT-1]